MARAGLQRQAIAVKPLAHLRHIALQRGAADKPLVGQILQLEGERRSEKAHHQVVHPLRAGAWDPQHPRVGILQLLVAGLIVNFQLIAVPAAEDKLRPVPRQQRVERGNVSPDGTRGYRQPLRQFVLRQRLVLQHFKQLR
ncbi:hypothetical protein D3C76_1267880 [compost metagenome]